MRASCSNMGQNHGINSSISYLGMVRHINCAAHEALHSNRGFSRGKVYAVPHKRRINRSLPHSNSPCTPCLTTRGNKSPSHGKCKHMHRATRHDRSNNIFIPYICLIHTNSFHGNKSRERYHKVHASLACHYTIIGPVF